MRTARAVKKAKNAADHGR